jgi:hypothetical protein
MLTPDELTNAGDYVSEVIGAFEINLLRDISLRIKNVILNDYDLNHQNEILNNYIEKQLTIAKKNIPKRIDKLMPEDTTDKTELTNEIENRLNPTNLNFGIKIGGILTAIPLMNMLYSFVTHNQIRANITGRSTESTLDYSLADIADSGVITPVGQNYRRMESVVGESTLTTVNKVETDKYKIEEKPLELWEVSAHFGARNKGTGPMNHESWQGKVYTAEQLKSVCGLGQGIGLLGWNCRHSYKPFTGQRTYTDKQLKEFKGRRIEYKGKKLDGYECTKMKSYMERRIRELRREQVVGLQTGDKISQQTQIYFDFCKTAGIKPEIGRTYLTFKI